MGRGNVILRKYTPLNWTVIKVLDEPTETGSKEDSTGDPEVGDNKLLSRVLRNSGIKTLSPRPDPSSPIKEIDSSWATIHTMFVKDDEEGTSSV